MDRNDGSGYRCCNSRNEVDKVQGHAWRIQLVLEPSYRLVSRQLDDATVKAFRDACQELSGRRIGNSYVVEASERICPRSLDPSFDVTHSEALDLH